MAATHGRLTGEAGMCLSTLGPGALNLTTGAAYAQLGAMPMVMITGQKGVLSRKQARFQVENGLVKRRLTFWLKPRGNLSPHSIPDSFTGLGFEIRPRSALRIIYSQADG